MTSGLVRLSGLVAILHKDVQGLQLVPLGRCEQFLDLLDPERPDLLGRWPWRLNGLRDVAGNQRPYLREAGLAGFEPATHGPGNRCSIP